MILKDDYESSYLEDKIQEQNQYYAIQGELNGDKVRNIVGQIYIPYKDGKEGFESYHFPTGVLSKGSQAQIQGKAIAGKTKEPYISYAGAPVEFNLLDGSKPPAKKYFEDPKYNSTSREFTGKITWGKNTFQGVYSQDYRMVFSPDFSFIESGEINKIDSQGKKQSSQFYGEDGLNYKNSIEADEA